MKPKLFWRNGQQPILLVFPTDWIEKDPERAWGNQADADSRYLSVRETFVCVCETTE